MIARVQHGLMDEFIASALQEDTPSARLIQGRADNVTREAFTVLRGARETCQSRCEKLEAAISREVLEEVKRLTFPALTVSFK